MIDFSQFDSLMTMTGYFNSEDICRQAIINSRYNNGEVICPHCDSHRISVRPDGRFRCKDCKHNFSCLVGTIFENTNLPLQKWFIAMYLISSLRIPVDTRSPIPVISVQSVGDLQYRWQS